MIYLELFLGFLIVGCFSFGGAYGAIPLIREVVMTHGWADEELFAYFVAVSESTPGPIMVNMATYVGSSQGGALGALLATTAVVLPAFLIILLVVSILSRILEHPYIKACLKGIEPCVIGIILATGVAMMWENVVADISNVKADIDAAALVITLCLAAFSKVHKKRHKKPLSPIALIVTAAVLGMILC